MCLLTTFCSCKQKQCNSSSALLISLLVTAANQIMYKIIVKMNVIAISPRSGFELQITTTLELKLSGCSARAI